MNPILSSAKNELENLKNTVAPCDCSTLNSAKIEDSKRSKGLAPDAQMSIPPEVGKTENDGIESWSSPQHHKLCVIVPYRDRFEELQIFTPFLSRFLKRQNLEFDLLILNQFDRYRFNRASLINVGYYEARRRRCDYMAMHDVDLLPNNAALNYSFPLPLDRNESFIAHIMYCNCLSSWIFSTKLVYHVASPEYHPKYGYQTFIGGILIISLDNFAKVNGMSNRYWGWGLEDDEFYLRLKEAELRIRRPENLSTNRNTTFQHIHDRRLRKRDTLRIGDQKRVSRRRDRISGVESVQYSVLSRIPMTVGIISLIVSVIELKDEMSNFFCYA